MSWGTDRPSWPHLATLREGPCTCEVPTPRHPTAPGLTTEPAHCDRCSKWLPRGMHARGLLYNGTWQPTPTAKCYQCEAETETRCEVCGRGYHWIGECHPNAVQLLTLGVKGAHTDYRIQAAQNAWCPDCATAWMSARPDTYDPEEIPDREKTAAYRQAFLNSVRSHPPARGAGAAGTRPR